MITEWTHNIIMFQRIDEIQKQQSNISFILSRHNGPYVLTLFMFFNWDDVGSSIRPDSLIAEWFCIQMC